jgi:hypothetical protein
VSKQAPANEPRPGLSRPAQRALAAAGIARLEQLTEYREADLLALHGMGPKAIETLRHALATRGLSLAGDAEEPSQTSPRRTSKTAEDRAAQNVDSATLRSSSL